MTETTTHDIAEHLAEHLEDHPDVCVDLNAVHGWLRFHDGDWQVARYAAARGHNCVIARTVDRDGAVAAIESNPSTLLPAPEAGAFSDGAKSIWEHADEQDAFSDADRCHWCGTSEHDAALTEYRTIEDGDCLLCPDCHESWEKAGEIVEPVAEVDPV